MKYRHIKTRAIAKLIKTKPEVVLMRFSDGSEMWMPRRWLERDYEPV